MIEKYIQIDKRRNQSIQEQLKQALYSVIMVRTLPENYQMPSISGLAVNLDVQEDDVKYAYDALVSEQFLIKTQDDYVIRQNILPVNQGASLNAMIEGITNIGLTPSMLNLDQKVMSLKELKKVEHKFDSDDHLINFTRLYLGNDHKIAYLDNYLSVKYFPGMETLDYRNFKIYPHIFEKYPGHYDIKRQFTIETMSKEVANLLDQTEGNPAIHVISQIYNSEGTQVEFSHIWVCAHFFKFQINVDFSL